MGPLYNLMEYISLCVKILENVKFGLKFGLRNQVYTACVDTYKFIIPTVDFIITKYFTVIFCERNDKLSQNLLVAEYAQAKKFVSEFYDMESIRLSDQAIC